MKHGLYLSLQYLQCKHLPHLKAIQKHVFEMRSAIIFLILTKVKAIKTYALKISLNE